VNEPRCGNCNCPFDETGRTMAQRVSDSCACGHDMCWLCDYRGRLCPPCQAKEDACEDCGVMRASYFEAGQSPRPADRCYVAFGDDGGACAQRAGSARGQIVDEAASGTPKAARP